MRWTVKLTDWDPSLLDWDPSLLIWEGRQCLPPRAGLGDTLQSRTKQPGAAGNIHVLLPSPATGLRYHRRSLDPVQADESLALTSTENLLNLAQVELLCGQHKSQDYA